MAKLTREQVENYMGVFQILRKAPQVGGLREYPPIFLSPSKVNETHPNHIKLQGAGLNLRKKNLNDLDLSGLNLQQTDLHSANLRQNIYNSQTQWDKDFAPSTAGTVKKWYFF